MIVALSRFPSGAHNAAHLPLSHVFGLELESAYMNDVSCDVIPENGRLDNL